MAGNEREVAPLGLAEPLVAQVLDGLGLVALGDAGVGARVAAPAGIGLGSVGLPFMASH